VRFASIPWLFSVVVLLPALGGGLFGFGLQAGPLPLIGNLLLHAVFGVVLGDLCGPRGEAVDSDQGVPVGSDIRAIPAAESGAAKGLLTGAIVGVVASGAALLLSQVAGGMFFISMSPTALLVMAALIGSAWGAVLGSLLGLSASTHPQE
jgi:hypothetical protein